MIRTLFYEIATHADVRKRHPPIYTLHDEDRKCGKYGVLPSARRIFLECEDPTEYKAAQELVGSWRHWRAICNSEALRDYIDEWREELEVRLRSKAIVNIREASTEGSKGMAASKWLADRGWRTKRGRPSKAEIAGERRIQSRINDDLVSDGERIHDVIMKGEE